MPELFSYQRDAIKRLKSGSILCGGVGSGKSLTALTYYAENAPQRPLYIVTTARKRDSGEWDEECEKALVGAYTCDSWNNIHKYSDIEDAFFIFDEQRVVGSGSWTKHFVKIAKCNEWILLTATPGDTWADYIPVFLAHGFYRNRSQFMREHAVYNRFSKYPKVDRWLHEDVLEAYRRAILVKMVYSSKKESHHEYVAVEYDKDAYLRVLRGRVNPETGEPLKNISEVCFWLRRVCNGSDSRIDAIRDIMFSHPRVIVFYNFDFELGALRGLGVPYSEWNGHRHDALPTGDIWAYFVQYNSGAEGWNCTDTDTVIFYSQTYSYKMMKQAAGRVDRLNSKFEHLYYYHLVSDSSIDRAIRFSLDRKMDFNTRILSNFVEK